MTIMVCHKFKTRRSTSSAIRIYIYIYGPSYLRLPSLNSDVLFRRSMALFIGRIVIVLIMLVNQIVFDVSESQSQAVELITDHRSLITDQRSLIRWSSIADRPATTLLGEILTIDHSSIRPIAATIDTYDIMDYDYGARVLFMYAKRITHNIFTVCVHAFAFFNTLRVLLFGYITYWNTKSNRWRSYWKKGCIGR